MDAYFDRFTIKIVRLHERMQKLILAQQRYEDKNNDILSGIREEICDLVESSNDDCRRLDILEIKIKGYKLETKAEATEG